jgi:hypothetical protein
MRRVLGIVIALLLAITLLPACGPGGGGEGGAGEGGTLPSGGDGTPSEYTGFMLPAEGQWVEYVMADEGEDFHQKMEHIGQDTVDGKTCIGFEMTMAMPQQGETIVQMWTDAATHQLVKYVMKTGGQVMCMDVGQSPYELPGTETPSQYNPSLPDISYGTYTIPGTGGTVTVAIFDVPGGEVWVSSQVPFGTVKVVASGTTTMYLYNFGTSGAQRDISKAEMENCMQMPGS